MKKDILKIAGVKSEKEFYKLFPSEQAFMKVHGKAFKKAKMGASMVSKQLTQLTDFDNPPQAQNGIISMPDFTKADKTINRQFNFENSGFNQGLQGFGKTLNDFSTGAKNVLTKANTSLGKIGGVKGAVEIGTGLMQGIQQIGEEKEARNKAKQFKELSGLTKQVAGLTPEMTKRKYSRPENSLIDSEKLNPYGLSAEQGMQIGGNPTELQNMYSSGDIYSDMGYEPFGESDRMKQYRKGGSVEKAQFGKMAGDFGGALGSLIGGGKGLPTGAGTIGGNIGSTIGKLTLIPGADAILGGIGGLVGGIFGGASAKKTQGIQDEANKNLQDAAFMQGTQKFQNQNAAFMENGGWVSHDWQPQVITQFGGYDMKDLLKKDDTMDTLRAGGHLKDYTAPSERAMSTERPQFAMGGKLKTHWGGDMEQVSYNPYMPGSGESHIGKGLYHSQGDGNGNTGIGMSYGDSMVEIENGEPVQEMKEGGSMDTSAVVYGNLPIPSYISSEINDDMAKGKTFKHYVNKLNEKENKQNKTIDKSLTLIDSVEGDSPFDTLTLNSGKAMMLGANNVLKNIADKKKMLAGGQNAILDTAKEMNLDVEALARNKIKKAKQENTSTAQSGANVAQSGLKTSKYPQEFEEFINQAMELEQKNAGKGGGNYFGTNRKNLNTPDKAKQFYYENYWKPIENLPSGLRTRALQLAINTGDPYGEILVASGKMDIDERRKLINQAKEKGLTGLEKDKYIREQRLKQNKEQIGEAVNMFQQAPQDFMQSLNNEQKRYYSSLVEANKFDPAFLNFYDQYVNLANRTGSQFVPSQASVQQKVPAQIPVPQPITQQNISISTPNLSSSEPVFNYEEPLAYTPMQSSMVTTPQQRTFIPPPTFGEGPVFDYNQTIAPTIGSQVVPSQISTQSGEGVLKNYQNPDVDISAAARFSKFMPYTPAYTPKKLEGSPSKPQFMQPMDFDKPFMPYTPEGLPDSRETDVVDPTLYDRLGVDRYFERTPVSVKSDASKKASSPNTQNLDFLRTIYNEALPYMRETDQMSLDPAQLYGEMYALQSNVPQGVQSQMYRPLLETEPAALATAQSQLNEITASANAARRMTGNNPAAQAMIASQEAQSKQQVLGQQMAANIQAKEAARQRNIGALNDATLKNLAILDNQYTRQTQANANTKATAQAALNSIASKIGQNKLENKQLGVMENLYNYRYDKSGRAINKNPLVDFQAILDNATPSQLEEYSKMTETTKKGRTSSAKNGSIVKAIKNL